MVEDEFKEEISEYTDQQLIDTYNFGDCLSDAEYNSLVKEIEKRNINKGNL